MLENKKESECRSARSNEESEEQSVENNVFEILEERTASIKTFKKEKQDSYSYSFTMSLNNLTAVLNDKREITISDVASGEALWYSGQNYGVMIFYNI